MPPSPTIPASRRRAGRRVGWDALVALGLGAALILAGWVDLRAYWASAGRPMATFGLVGQTGDTRIDEDEFFHSGAMVVRLHNVSRAEGGGEAPFRHALGPTVTLETWSTQTHAQVDFILANDFPSQDITVACDGQTLDQFHLAPGKAERSYRFPLHPGANQFTITFACYNHHGIDFDNGETRPVAGTFYKLDLHF